MKWQGPKLPPGVSATPGKPKADGSVSWYFYYKPTKTKLLQTPGTPAFEREVQRAAGAGAEPVVKVETLSDICDGFEKSVEHKRCEPYTRLTRERVLEKIRFRWGEYTAAQLSDRRFRGEIKEWRDTMFDTPNMADKSVQTLQRVMWWAYDGGKIQYDHSKKIGRLSAKQPRAEKVVTPEQEVALLACATPADRRFYLLARYTALRESDLCILKWSDIGADGFIEWLHSKTKKTTKARSYYAPFALPPLRALLDEMPRFSIYPSNEPSDLILSTDTGRALTPKNLKYRWAAWCARAQALNPTLDFSDIHFHDLRRTTNQDLLNAGCTNAEAASITGHRVSDSADGAGGSFEIYASRSRALGEAAYRKWASRLVAASTDKKVVPFRSS
jgi:integrase